MSPEQLIGASGIGITAITMLCIVGSFVLTIPITIGAIVLVRRMFGPDKETLTNGIAAQATILSISQTGTYINNNPQAALVLEVRPPNGQPYQTSVAMVIPMVNLPQFQPGVNVPVKINPKNPNKVVLDVYG